MSLQWTLIATFLYSEIALCVLLMISIISARRWQTIFRSRLLHALASHANWYFYAFMFVLVILFVDGAWEVKKWSKTVSELHLTDATTDSTIHMKLFRAQRNLYISGFTVFLAIVVRRLVKQISDQATLEAEVEAMRRQAISASETASRLLDEQRKSTDCETEKTEVSESLVKANDEINSLKTELHRCETDVEAMKRQSQSTKNAFDRLLEEHAKLQEKFEQVSGDTSDKKDD